jgi:hypothetical protein
MKTKFLLDVFVIPAKRKDKAMKRSDTDDFWIKIEILQWVLFVIFAVKNGNMVVI